METPLQTLEVLQALNDLQEKLIVITTKILNDETERQKNNEAIRRTLRACAGEEEQRDLPEPLGY